MDFQDLSKSGMPIGTGARSPTKYDEVAEIKEYYPWS